MTQAKKTLIIGSGDCALQLAGYLAAGGMPVILAGTPPQLPDSAPDGRSAAGAESIAIAAGACISRCEGVAGGFKVTLSSNGSQQTTHEIGSIAVAEDTRRSANYAALGLQPSAFVKSLSDFKAWLADGPQQKPAALDGKTVVFLNGLAQESTPVIAAEIMQAALELQDLPGVRAFVLTSNLKVAGNGLETLYHRAKTAGVLFVKFSATRPRIDQAQDGPVTFLFTDEASGGMMRLQADLTVVDESILPSEELQRLGRILELDTDSAGFLQTANVHRWPVFTNRRGILAAGPARAVLLPDEIKTDAAAAAGAVLGRTWEPDAAQVTASIEPGKCVRCLTCYRLCPHRAVQKAARMAVAPEACAGCGICAAECPRGAISMGESGTPFVRELEQFTAQESKTGLGFVAFCCSRSAGRAAELAESLNLKLPAGLKIVEVPCAGAIAVRHILAALTGGAEGVLVLSCHAGNCHSEQGNILAGQRAALICEQLHRMGWDPERLQFQTLAANMAVEFADTVQRFEQNLIKLKTDPRRGKNEQ